MQEGPLSAAAHSLRDRYHAGGSGSVATVSVAAFLPAAIAIAIAIAIANGMVRTTAMTAIVVVLTVIVSPVVLPLAGSSLPETCSAH